MAQVTITGSVSMDALHLRDLFGSDITIATSTDLNLRVAGGAITSFPGHVFQFANVSLGGTGFTYDANSQINGGTATSFRYLPLGEASGRAVIFSITGMSIGAQQLYSWFITDSTQTALSTILSGNDLIECGSVQGATPANLVRGYAGNDLIQGGAGDDSLFGGTGDDTIDGGYAGTLLDQGANVLRGEEGNDRIYGGEGPDDIDGGAGNDTLTGDSAAPNLTERGADLFRVSAGSDLILDFNLSEGDQIRIGSGVTYTVTQQGADTAISLSDGGRLVLAGVVASTLTGNWISSSTIGTNPGQSSSLSYDSVTSSAALAILATDKVAFSTGSATQLSVLYGVDTITLAMGGKSVIFGNNIATVSQAGNLTMPDGSAVYIGLTGSDSFVGKATGDAAFGGFGNDTLDGADGADLLQGNQGGDRLVGGAGSDTVYGGQDDDMLILGEGANFGQGNRGNDQVIGGEGADTILGGQDNDIIQGSGGADLLNGNRGDDSISGGGGADTLYGEGGADTLSGGAGADLFHGFSGGELDRIVDFSRSEGDRIVLDPGTAYTVSQVAGDVVVAFGGSNQIVLVGVAMSSLTGDWISA